MLSRSWRAAGRGECCRHRNMKRQRRRGQPQRGTRWRAPASARGPGWARNENKPVSGSACAGVVKAAAAARAKREPPGPPQACRCARLDVLLRKTYILYPEGCVILGECFSTALNYTKYPFCVAVECGRVARRRGAGGRPHGADAPRTLPMLACHSTRNQPTRKGSRGRSGPGTLQQDQKAAATEGGASGGPPWSPPDRTRAPYLI